MPCSDTSCGRHSRPLTFLLGLFTFARIACVLQLWIKTSELDYSVWAKIKSAQIKSLMHVQSCCFANLNLLLFCRYRCRRRRRILSSLLCPTKGKVQRVRTSSLHLDQPSFRWWPVLCISFNGSIFPRIGTCHFFVFKLRYCFYIWGLFCNIPKMRFPPFSV